MVALWLIGATSWKLKSLEQIMQKLQAIKKALIKAPF